MTAEQFYQQVVNPAINTLDEAVRTASSPTDLDWCLGLEKEVDVLYCQYIDLL